MFVEMRTAFRRQINTYRDGPHDRLLTAIRKSRALRVPQRSRRFVVQRTSAVFG